MDKKFLQDKFQNSPCKKIKVLLETWKILKKDLDILKQVMEYTTPFHENHIQEKNPKTPHMNLAQRQQVQVEIIMLKKGSFARPIILNGSF